MKPPSTSRQAVARSAARQGSDQEGFVTVWTAGRQARSRGTHPRVPGRTVALRRWARVRHRRLHRHQVPRQRERMRSVHAARQVPAHAGQDPDAPGPVLHRQGAGQVRAHRTDDAAHRQRIDSAEGRALYERRFATVEPLFANLRHDTTTSGSTASRCAGRQRWTGSGSCSRWCSTTSRSLRVTGMRTEDRERDPSTAQQTLNCAKRHMNVAMRRDRR